MNGFTLLLTLVSLVFGQMGGELLPVLLVDPLEVLRPPLHLPSLLPATNQLSLHLVAGLYKVPYPPPPERRGEFVKSVGEEYQVVKSGRE